MIDPENITKFDRTENQLQEFLLLCLVVAGKTAAIQAGKLDQFLYHAKTLAQQIALKRSRTDVYFHGGNTPFDWIRIVVGPYNNNPLHAKLRELLVMAKLGQYARLEGAIRSMINLDGKLHRCTLQELTAIPGIGAKTARMFILHSRRDAQCAVLDTHILRFLREELKVRKVPKTSPPEGPVYARLEAIFLGYCRSLKRPPAEVDLRIWTRYSRAAKTQVRNSRTANG